MSTTPVRPIFGGTFLHRKFTPESATEDIYNRLEAGSCTHIDIGHIAKGIEEWIGKTGGGKRFYIDSKTPGGLAPGTSNRAGILQHARELHEFLVIEGKVDVYYIHMPDPSLPITEMLAGINDAHQAGYFARFGLSNFPMTDVENIHSICTVNGWALPTVYQGSYSAISRKPETVVLPTLRRLGISFHAYSPLCGGFLTKTPEQIRGGGEDAGKFSKSGGLHAEMYNSMYNKPSYLQALVMWADVAEQAGCSKAELAYRWLAYDSALSTETYGDAVCIGASSGKQLSETLEWFKKGSVGEEARRKIAEIWRVVEGDAPLDNYDSFFRDNRERYFVPGARTQVNRPAE